MTQKYDSQRRIVHGRRIFILFFAKLWPGMTIFEILGTEIWSRLTIKFQPIIFFVLSPQLRNILRNSLIHNNCLTPFCVYTIQISVYPA